MLPVARTTRESALYRWLHPCSCGAHGPETWPAETVRTDAGYVRREYASCDECGRYREFLFAVPDPADPEPDGIYGGARPSDLIDAGEWLWVGSRDAQDALRIGGRRRWWHLTSPRGQAGRQWESAAAAISEAIKLVPDGSPAVPDKEVVAYLGLVTRRVSGSVGRDPLSRESLEERLRRYQSGRSMDDELLMPQFSVGHAGDRGRQILVDALADRHMRAVDGDTSALLSADALLEIEALCGQGTRTDLLACYVAGWMSWYRYLWSSSGSGLDDLARALALLGVVHEQGSQVTAYTEGHFEPPADLLPLIRCRDVRWPR